MGRILRDLVDVGLPVAPQPAVADENLPVNDDRRRGAGTDGHIAGTGEHLEVDRAADRQRPVE